MKRGTFNDILDEKMGPEEIDETDAFLNILTERVTNDMSTETLLRILPNLTDILCDIEYFENQINYINNEILHPFKRESNDKFENSEQLLIHRSNQIIYQYDFFNRKFERSELLANIAYLSNAIAHRIGHCIAKKRFDKEDDEYFKTKCRKTGLQEHSMRDLQQSFYNLKDDCIKELLECEKNGENVHISSYDDIENQNKVVFICLPNYFGPFAFHYDENKIPGIPHSVIHPFPFKTIFNFKVTEEQNEMFQWLEKNYFGPNKRNIEWYIQNQLDFEHKISQTTSSKIEEHLTTVKTKTVKRSKWRNNQEFIERAQEKIGMPFSQALHQELLNRTTSVNFDKIYARLQNEIYNNLDSMGIEQEHMEADSLKCILWLKLSYGLAGIGNGTVNGEVLTKRIVDSVLTYQEAFKYMQTHPDATIKQVKDYVNEKTESEDEKVKKHENKQSIIDSKIQQTHSINVTEESFSTIATVLQSKLAETDRELEEAQRLMREAKEREEVAKAERDALIKTLQELGILPKEEGVKNK